MPTVQHNPTLEAIGGRLPMLDKRRQDVISDIVAWAQDYAKTWCQLPKYPVVPLSHSVGAVPVEFTSSVMLAGWEFPVRFVEPHVRGEEFRTVSYKMEVL